MSRARLGMTNPLQPGSEVQQGLLGWQAAIKTAAESRGEQIWNRQLCEMATEENDFPGLWPAMALYPSPKGEEQWK